METNAELFYYKKQIDAHTPMVIVLLDGEEIEGTIEWYDRGAFKVNRKSAPNLLLLQPHTACGQATTALTGKTFAW